jgi:TetR/AcrR family transcriptional regulator
MVKIQGSDPSQTENRIMQAARSVFIRNGFDGTTMQQIADEAGMNKSLLHYYFRNKENLFEAVFAYAFRHFVPQIRDIFTSDLSLEKKIERIVSEYMDMLLQNEILPAFILHEINRDPERLFLMMQETGLDVRIFLEGIQHELGKNGLRSMDPKHLMVNLIALCIFPVAARPLVQRILFSNDPDAYSRFLLERKQEVARFILQSIQM